MLDFFSFLSMATLASFIFRLEYDLVTNTTHEISLGVDYNI